jgi:hypothetical protein
MMRGGFEKYMNPVFIETGSYGGDGIVAAMKAGFKRIFSIELSEHYYNICHERYSMERNVFLYHGDSLDVLPRILKIINEPITFWLDAHFCGDVTGKGKVIVPIMEELDIIAQHSIKTHTILIDDMRLVRDKNSEWYREMGITFSIEDIENKLLTINPNYNISYISGFVKQDILVAKV